MTQFADPTAEQPPAPHSDNSHRSGAIASLWDRQLEHYPSTPRRYTYLAVTVLATIVLYYELYVQGAVSTKIMADFGMSFTTLVMILVIGNLLGAFASLGAGLADRWGRANLVVWGLLVTALLVLFALPLAPNTAWYGFFVALLSIVEGAILVATPALIRDFSPQVGRASAMAFWTMGPVLGSLLVTVISSNTLDSHPDWRFQFHVCGIIGLIVAVIAIATLRELSPGLRDQLMVSLRERTLVEARARGLDIEAANKGQWKQMMRPDIVGPAIGVSLFLLLYYIFVAFLVVYFATTFGYSEAKANALGNWYWLANVIALIVGGVLSDKLRVRKPFMLVGGVVSIIGTIVFGMLTTHPDTSYYTFAGVIVVISGGAGVAYCAWMASFTETVEHHNPAATATGLAVWGWIIRLVVAGSYLALPFVVPATSTLVDHGNKVAAIVEQYPDQIATAQAVDPATLTALADNPQDAQAGNAAVTQLMKAGLASDPQQAVGRLQQLSTQPIPAADQKYLAAHAADVQQAQKDNPHQWQRWWWVCVICQIIFIPLAMLTVGRWLPGRARKDAEEHEAMIEREIAALHAEKA